MKNNELLSVSSAPLNANSKLINDADRISQPIHVVRDQRNQHFHLKAKNLHQSALTVCIHLQTTV